jgi:hypothetical protein
VLGLVAMLVSGGRLGWLGLSGGVYSKWTPITPFRRKLGQIPGTPVINVRLLHSLGWAAATVFRRRVFFVHSRRFPGSGVVSWVIRLEPVSSFSYMLYSCTSSARLDGVWS